MKTQVQLFVSVILIVIINWTCQPENNPADIPTSKAPLFNQIQVNHSGITFKNTVVETYDFNFLQYAYIYNGGGVSIGDINNDGLDDVFFTANQEANKLYLNQGNLKFKDISTAAGIEDPVGWTTGTCMIDINNDGWLDMYVCKSGSPSDGEARKNRLFINQKNNTFKEAAAEFGLNDPAYSTQAYFFDLDNDDDLDMYLVNHRPDFTNNSKVSTAIQQDISPITSDKIYRNDNGTFKDLYPQGFNKAWGLSAAIHDYNEDGFLDVYVANDFLEPDHLWINDQRGSFKDSILQMLDHISFYSMGSDIADINNDLKPDLVVLDMVSPNHVRSKRNMASMDSKSFYQLIDLGYHHQYMSNALHLNRGNSTYSNISQFAGIAKTDWSWAPLLADFDNDEFKDLFVTNGIKRDITDNDFKINVAKRPDPTKPMTLEELFTMIPSEKLQNYVFKNEHNTRFSNQSINWGLSQIVNSNGAAYGDLDNDGDLDLVINNLDDTASIYENKASNNYLKIHLKGSPKNVNGIGAKITIESASYQQYYEQFVNRGFQSSVSNSICVGLGIQHRIESLNIVWPDGKSETIEGLDVNQMITLDIKNASEELEIPNTNKSLITEIKDAEQFIPYRHQENFYNDFEREILLPQKLSTLGPNASIGDVNDDGLEDVFIGGSKEETATLYIQQNNGRFKTSNQTLFQNDKSHEDASSLFLDVDGDNDLDLYVASGGNESEEGSDLLEDRLYLNDGSGKFTKSKNIIPSMRTSNFCVTGNDFDQDGDIDLFIGGRCVPGKYPTSPKSYLLENNKGVYSDITEKTAKDLRQVGMVTDALFSDFDGDNDIDLIVVGEWMNPIVFVNNDGNFEKKDFIDDKNRGWWYSINSADFNQDGLPDYVLGNLGLNNKFKNSHKKSFHLYASDFDDNGSLDIVLAKESNGDVLPVRGRQCSSEQMPFIEEKFPTFKSFAEADLYDIYSSEKIENAIHLEIDDFSSIILINKGNGAFETKSLPNVAQYGPTLATQILDINKDGHLDIIGVGNIYNTEPETIRYDASKGFVLVGNGKGDFEVAENSGFLTKGNVKDIQPIKIDGIDQLLVLQNDGPIQLFRLD